MRNLMQSVFVNKNKSVIPIYVHIYLSKQKKKTKLWNNTKYLVMAFRDLDLFL